MNQEDFNNLMQDRFNKSRTTMILKSGEYSRGGDKLHNFKRAAAMQGNEPEKALWGMLAKHIISVQDMTKEPGTVNQDMIDEKIGDMQNYLYLLEALFIERLQGDVNLFPTEFIPKGSLKDTFQTDQSIFGTVKPEPDPEPEKRCHIAMEHFGKTFAFCNPEDCTQPNCTNSENCEFWY